MTAAVVNLAALGNVVDHDYRHVTKRITPRAAEAWTRYLRSERDEAAKQAYVRSQFSGTI